MRTRNIPYRMCLWAFAALSLLAACDGGTPSVELFGPDGNTPAGSACGHLNETAACSCGMAPGSRTCTADGWSDCRCTSMPDTLGDAGPSGPAGPTPTPAGNLRSDITFDWERTKPSDASCEPGHYEGTFAGLYSSRWTVVGVPIPVASIGGAMHPGLSFTLEQSATGEVLEIRDGEMQGTANGLWPFTGTITGSLDCETLQFDAILDGQYSHGIDGILPTEFRGPIVARYDMNTHSLVEGTWDVEEDVNIYGGFGTWDAHWIP